MSLPKPLKELLSNLKKDDACSTEGCKTCSAYKINYCCTRPGFQTYENTLLIHKKFYSHMEYKDFIDEYYYEPQYMYERGIMVVFYPKVRDKVNPDDESIYNGGCVFTKKPLTGEPNEQYMNCSLYDSKCYDDITTFPIGCITDLGDNNFENYYIFNQYRMAMLNYFYPNSSEKFRKKYWKDLVENED